MARAGLLMATVSMLFSLAGSAVGAGSFNRGSNVLVSPRFIPPPCCNWTLTDWLLTDDLDWTIEHEFDFGGAPGDVPIAGDWNGDGIDTVGVFRLRKYFVGPGWGSP